MPDYNFHISAGLPVAKNLGQSPAIGDYNFYTSAGFFPGIRYDETGLSVTADAVVSATDVASFVEFVTVIADAVVSETDIASFVESVIVTCDAVVSETDVMGTVYVDNVTIITEAFVSANDILYIYDDRVREYTTITPGVDRETDQLAVKTDSKKEINQLEIKKNYNQQQDRQRGFIIRKGVI